MKIEVIFQEISGIQNKLTFEIWTQGAIIKTFSALTWTPNTWLPGLRNQGRGFTECASCHVLKLNAFGLQHSVYSIR